MSVRIKMYNAYFGDCFVIENNNSNLVVDFGIRRDSVITATTLDKQLEDIANDLGYYQNKSLLITHFHYDHISGLTRRYSKKCSMGLFDEVYIPDILNKPRVIASQLMEDAITRILMISSVPGYIGKPISLFDLLIFLCGNVDRVRFLRRGSVFEDEKYIALLPDNEILDEIRNEFESMDMPRILDDIREVILDLSDKLSYMLVTSESLSRLSENREEYIKEIRKYRTQYNRTLNRLIAENAGDEGNGELFETHYKLNGLNNKISIVFQNCANSNENLLFTGDAEGDDLRRISTYRNPEMHTDYKYIKLPHHGTDSHYFDIKKYKPQYVMIPNGKTSKNDQISARYGGVGKQMICSNSNHCNNCKLRCSTSTLCCGKSRIVYPMICTWV